MCSISHLIPNRIHFLIFSSLTIRASQVKLVVKTPSANGGDIRDAGLIPGLERSPGEGQGNPLHYSCLISLAMLSLFS